MRKLIPLLLLLSCGGAHAASFQLIATSPNHNTSAAQGISADGTTVIVTSSGPSSASEAWRWTSQTGAVSFGDDMKYVNYKGISGDGGAVIGYGGGVRYRWTSNAGVEVFQPMYASAISDSGLVYGGGSYSGTSVWSQAVWSQADGYAVVEGALNLNGLSGDGSIAVGTARNGEHNEAYIWSKASGLNLLGTLSNTSLWSESVDVSSDGRVVIGNSETSATSQGAFIWTAESGMRFLGQAGDGADSYASAVSGDGSIVYGASDGIWVWTEQSGMQNVADVLSLQGVDMGNWRIGNVSGVSDNGRTIVGSAQLWDEQTQSYGKPTAYIANLQVVPIPAALWLFGSGLGLLGWMRKRS